MIASAAEAGRRTSTPTSSRTRALSLRTLPLALALAFACLVTPSLALAEETNGERALRDVVRELEKRIRQLEERLERATATAPAPAPAPAPAAPPPAPSATEDALRDRVEELDQQVRIVSRKLELEQEASAARAKDAPVIQANREGFGLRSADGAFRLRIGGTVHADTRAYLNDDFPGPSPDTFVLRRVRPNLEGTVGEKFGFRIQPELGNAGTMTLLDAHADLNFTPVFRIRAGKFKAPVGLERLQSPADMPFVERAFPTQLLPNRDNGVQLFGDVLDNRLSYAAGFFNGVRDGASADTDTSSGKDFNARLFAHPFRNSDDDDLRNLGVGVSMTSGTQGGSATNSNLSPYLTPGQQTFFAYSTGTFASGGRHRVSPQFYYYRGPLGVMGEYALSTHEVTRATRHAEITHRAWQLYATYYLTGEDASFGRVTPRQPFDSQRGTWGAFEVGLRISQLAVDGASFEGTTSNRFADPDTSARKATDLGLVLNWHLNRNIRVQTNFDITRFEGGAPRGGDLPDEKVLFSRFQAAF